MSGLQRTMRGATADDWEPHPPTPGSIQMKRLFAAVAITTSLLAVPTMAAAAPKGTVHAGAAACSVAGTVVSATGLPTDQVINFMVTDNAGTHGWVLGFTHDGVWTVDVPAANGPTSYQFVS